jgi:hypothetical protein
MACKFGKSGSASKIGMHEGEIVDVREVSCLRPNADFQIWNLLCEGVAPCLGVANMFVEIDDEQRHNRPLCCSIICCNRNPRVLASRG